jgi:inosine-uridine nucleoside N-ribohydrolase
LIGISTVGGNQTLDNVTRNALNALHVMNLDSVPCVAGSEHALMSSTVPCPEIHGASGLDTKAGYVWPAHTLQPLPGKAIAVMSETILAQPQRVHLIATGRLTNVALLLSVYPETLRNVKQITIMGGALRGGNTHPVAEFNIQGDPEAAQVVFNHGCDREQYAAILNTYPELRPRLRASPDYMKPRKADISTSLDADAVLGTHVPTASLRVPVVLVPLEVTHSVLVTPAVVADVQRGCAAVEPAVKASEEEKTAKYSYSDMCTALFTFFGDTYRDVFGFEHGPPLHDPAAVAFALLPSLFTATHMRVDVECNGRCAGQTVADIWGQTGKAENVIVAETVDAGRFWEEMVRCIVSAARESPLNK